MDMATTHHKEPAMTTFEIPDYTQWPAGEMIFELAAISGRLFNEDPNELAELTAHHDAILQVAEDRGYTMKWSDKYCIQMFTWVEDGNLIDRTDGEM
jgi:hypothetical protein